MTKSKILITGCAGFIGFSVAKRLMNMGYSVVGIDNISAYYDVSLKKDRLRKLGVVCNSDGTFDSLNESFNFIFGDIANENELKRIFENHKIDVIISLAAQAGVRYSLSNPYSYLHSNILGFLNLLEIARNYPIKKILYASSSSVYGNIEGSCVENDHSIRQESFYAVTKRTNELMADVYAKLYGIELIGMRFFTVFGPWGRPDMATDLFTKSILNGTKIDVYNSGELYRDWTYIDDVVDGIILLLGEPNQTDKQLSRIYNIGNSTPIKLGDFIEILEDLLSVKAKLNLMPMQKGDVFKTNADISLINRDYGYKPKFDLKRGLGVYLDWFREYYG